MQFREYHEYLIFTIFVASGISFLKGALPGLIVRMAVAAVGMICALLLSVAIGLAFALSDGLGAFSAGPDGARMLGTAMLVFYFAGCSLSCSPRLSIRNLRHWGMVLHFIYMPIAVFLTTFSAMSLPVGIRTEVYANALLFGLVYAMLWFRMVDMQPQIGGKTDNPSTSY